MTSTRRVSCLARIEPNAVASLTTSLAAIDHLLPVILRHIVVTELGLLAPAILVLDLDDIEVDPVETLRMLRFVLPGCVVAVYTRTLEDAWAAACHTAGANCLLSKSSDAIQNSVGLSRAILTGCYTDPSFGVA